MQTMRNAKTSGASMKINVRAKEEDEEKAYAPR